MNYVLALAITALAPHALLAQEVLPRLHDWWDAQETKTPEEPPKHEPAKEHFNGGFRVGALIPTSAKEEKLGAIPAAGLYYHADWLKSPEWRIELAADAAFSSDDDIRVYLFRVGAVYQTSKNFFLLGGLGFATERADFGPGRDITNNVALFEIGAMLRIPVGEGQAGVDFRLDYFVFAGSDNTTGAVYLTIGLSF